MSWSVVQTESSREGVAQKFLQAGGYRVYWPRILLKKDRVAPLFPGYLFVQIEREWWSVRWSIGVVRLLMWDEVPARLDDKVVEAIMKREDGGFVKLPKKRGLEKGDRVRIVRGSFEGKVGVYEGMSGPERVSVLLDLLGRAVPVSLGAKDIVAQM